MARSQVYRFGPGSLESLELRVWSRNRTFGAVLCARLAGTYRVYCGEGGEHTLSVSERVEETRRSVDTPETLAELVTALRDTGDPDLADTVAREILAGALEDWSDPCAAYECDGSCICRPHVYAYGTGGRFRSPVCQRSGCGVMGTGDPCGDGECEGGPDPDACAFTGSDNHSADIVRVHHGAADPVMLCGYHASPEWLPTVLSSLRCSR